MQESITCFKRGSVKKKLRKNQNKEKGRRRREKERFQRVGRVQDAVKEQTL